jgi:uncharacterized membrane protein YgcG
MRIARPLGLIAALLATATLLAPVAAAEPPFRLSEPITDKAGVLTPAGRSQVKSAIDKLHADRRIRLWVVFVESFNGQPAVGWAQSTMHTSHFGDRDALLAVAVADRAYAFLVPPGISGITSSQVDNLRHDQIEPALHHSDWSRAAVAAANGLNTTGGGGLTWTPFLIALGVVALAVAVLWLAMRRRRRRRRDTTW